MFNTTEIYEPLSLVLGDGIVLPEWEEAFQERCAGEKVMMVVTPTKSKLMRDSRSAIDRAM